MRDEIKILHTADWHLGKKLEQFSRLEEQRQFVEEIISIAEEEEVDIVLVAGDLFDQFSPSTEAIELLYNALKRLSNRGQRPVIAIAGNHDSPDRIEVSDPLAKACGILMIGHPHVEVDLVDNGDKWRISKSAPGFLEIEWDHISVPLRLIHTPYVNEYRIKTFLGVEDVSTEMRQYLAKDWNHLAQTFCDESGVNILMTHLFVMERGSTMTEEPEGEKPIVIGNAAVVYSDNLPDNIQYAALGHLHRYQHIKGQSYPIVYSSSPLAYSFAEAGQQKQVVLIEARPQQDVVVRPRALSSGKILHRKRFSDIDKCVEWLESNPDTLVELTIQSDDYLTAQDRKRLYNAHRGIVTLVPDVKLAGQNTDSAKSTLRLDQSMNTLFAQFFEYKIGQRPSKDIMEVFSELLNDDAV
ncbi:metallophosphoesterase family protein [Membranihabitans marinus]|uniref:metallophosphoesterase family protein n=1 Tax=Membranihabitans marinus TaxID=1227546 RepID=UPI001F023271|nr:exonuclease subunit SbcD [Membranihabitans marinus]